MSLQGTEILSIKDSEWTKLQIILVSLLQALDDGRPIKSLRNNWSLLGRGFYLQCAMIAAMISIVSSLVGFTSRSSTSTLSPAESKSVTSSTPARPVYVRSKLADNGRPFPTLSGYIEGYPIDAENGYSKVTIDNSENDSDVFVKLFSLGAPDTGKSKPVRVFFVRANQRFTVENLTPGNYDVRYRNLDTGKLQRSEPLQLEEFRTTTGVRFSRTTLTLYKVRDGNAQIYDISESEF